MSAEHCFPPPEWTLDIPDATEQSTHELLTLVELKAVQPLLMRYKDIGHSVAIDCHDGTRVEWRDFDEQRYALAAFYARQINNDREDIYADADTIESTYGETGVLAIPRYRTERFAEEVNMLMTIGHIDVVRHVLGAVCAPDMDPNLIPALSFVLSQEYYPPLHEDYESYVATRIKKVAAEPDSQKLTAHIKPNNLHLYLARFGYFTAGQQQSLNVFRGPKRPFISLISRSIEETDSILRRSLSTSTNRRNKNY